jgi:ketosteroid isomerase-like protein
MKNLPTLPTTLFFILLTACGPSALTKKEMKVILHRQNQMLAEAFKAGDAEKLSMMYTDSAKLYPNRDDIFIGRQAIKAFWEKDMAVAKLQEMNTQTLTVDGNKDIIYETGKSTSKILYKDSIYIVTVKFANVWCLQPNGDYRLDVDIWNDVKK